MTFSEIAAAVGLLTPLVLGLAALAKDILSRKEQKQENLPVQETVVQGMTVQSDFAGQLIEELRTERAEDKAEIAELKAKLQAYREMDRKQL